MVRQGSVARADDGSGRKPLPAEADVVVVGGGAIGVSTAFHLAEAGRRVVLVERDEIASGSTCRAAGGIRAQFFDPVNIAIMKRATELFEHFSERPGADLDLVQDGYLWLIDRPEHLELFEKGVALQNSLGVPSRIVSAEEARRLSPLVTGGDIIAGAYYERDGHCTPETAAAAYATAARGLGAHIARHTTVTGIETEGGAVSAVVTDRGTIRTPQVVIAAGAWSKPIGAMLGLSLPVEPVRRQIVVTEPIEGLDPHITFTVDFASTFYFHNEGPGLLFGYSDLSEPVGVYDTTPTDRFMELIAEQIERLMPGLGEVGIASHWAGLYEMTPDHTALVGAADAVPGAYYACGFSGHGFMQSPAIGEIVRDLVLGRTPAIDVSGMSADRFADGRALHQELALI